MDDGRRAMLTPHQASPKRQKRAHPTSGDGGTSSNSLAHVAPAKSKRPLRNQVPQEQAQEQERSLVEVLLPEELVCHVFSMLPKGMLAIAGRTCRRWFYCCPLSYRFKFDITTLCSRLSLLKWAQQNGYSLDRYTCAAAAAQGNTSVLSWLRDEEQGCHWDELTCRGAALHGHLEVLRWLRDRGCPWSATVCSSAARNGHLELLKWARRAGCDWDEEVCRMAAKEGRLDVLRWAMEHGCPWDETACAEAARSGHLEIVKW
ncbi:Ankyrin repeat domain containing protein, partial [Balamuthia mandrillaris]